MKKSILMVAFTALVGAAFAFNAPQEAAGAKKTCTAKEKRCCKKGAEAKACDKKSGEKTEAKAAEPKK